MPILYEDIKIIIIYLHACSHLFNNPLKCVNGEYSWDIVLDTGDEDENIKIKANK